MRFTGSLIASEAGVTTRYGLYKTQERGQMFVGPQTEVYEGMIVGENPKNDDIAINPCQEKPPDRYPLHGRGRKADSGACQDFLAGGSSSSLSRMTS